MSDIAEFLTAQLDEDEAIARAATPAPWRSAVSSDGRSRVLGGPHVRPGQTSDNRIVCRDGVYPADWPTEIVNSKVDAVHIARHDPARVLREVAVKRRVLARHRLATDEDLGWSSYVGACFGCGTYGEFADARTPDVNDCPELRDLAAPYGDRPGYKPAWRVA
jgi:hypothetical protein